MLKDHLQLIRLILERVPPESWPAAFTGVIVKECDEKSEVARFLRNVLQGQARAGFDCDPSYDLIEEPVIPSRDLPRDMRERKDPLFSSIGFLPSRCHYNGVDPIFDPSEAFELLEVDESQVEIVALLHAIDQYTADMVVPLKCAVHPYADCALITTVLFALRKRIRDGQMLSFVPADWADLPDNLQEQNPCDLTYMSSALKDRQSAKYCFRNIKSSISEGQILFNAAAYAKAQARGQYPHTVSTYGVNFNGDFNPNADCYIDYFNNSRGESIPIQLYGQRTDFDYEAKTILALANGAFPLDAVVPSMQGFLWAVECGYLLNPNQSLGSLITEKARSSDGAVGYGVKIQETPPSPQGEDRARCLLTALIDVQKLFGDQMYDRLNEDGGNAKRLFGLIKGPIVFARGYDSGILSRIPADLALKAAFPGGSLFEKEFAYVPSWWTSLDTESDKQSVTPARFDAIAELRELARA